MSRYASNGGGPLNASREFKEMVKAFHNVGIEVFFFHFMTSQFENLFHARTSSVLLVLPIILKILRWNMVLLLFQVILDVVYNHTNEADDEYPYTTSFRGIDNKVINLFTEAK